MKISDDTLLVSEDWSALFARVVVLCCKEARGNVVTFYSVDFSDVGELAKGNLVSNCRFVKKHFAKSFILDSMIYHMLHLYS